MPGVQVNKSDLAHIFGVDQPTIDSWISRGLPHMRKRKPNASEKVIHDRELIFDTADAINWRLSVGNLENDW